MAGTGEAIVSKWMGTRIVNVPLGATETDVADPSHSEFTPLPAYDDAMSVVVAAVVGGVVTAIYPAVVGYG